MGTELRIQNPELRWLELSYNLPQPLLERGGEHRSNHGNPLYLPLGKGEDLD